MQLKTYKITTETIEKLSRKVVMYDIVGYTKVNETHVQYLRLLITPRAESGYLDFENIVIACLHS